MGFSYEFFQYAGLARTAFGRQPTMTENARFIKRNQANEEKEILPAVALGIGLSASTGFRVFFPLLIAWIASLLAGTITAP
jgi:hypothetical protein